MGQTNKTLSSSTTSQKRSPNLEFLLAEVCVLASPWVADAAETATLPEIPEPEPSFPNEIASRKRLEVQPRHGTTPPERLHDIEFNNEAAASESTELETPSVNAAATSIQPTVVPPEVIVPEKLSNLTPHSDADSDSDAPQTQNSEAIAPTSTLENPPDQNTEYLAQNRTEFSDRVPLLTPLDVDERLTEFEVDNTNTNTTEVDDPEPFAPPNQTESTREISEESRLEEETTSEETTIEAEPITTEEQTETTFETPEDELETEINSPVLSEENLGLTETPSNADLNVDSVELEEPEDPPTEEEEPVAIPTETLQTVVNGAIASTVKRYPYIVDPTDRFTFAPESFDPTKFEDYSTSNVRFAEDNPILNKFTYAHFPEDQQFLWIVDGNKIVVETEGMQGGIAYQGRSTRTQGTLTALLRQRFLGVQTIFSIPQTLDDLVGEVSNFQGVLAIAGSITTPEGVPAGEVILNSGFSPDDPNVVRLSDLTPVVANPNTGSTSSPRGGGSLFTNLDAENTPKILQGFPTFDLSPLIRGIQLEEDEVIPSENLEAAGIGFSSPLTNLGFEFSAPLTSRPGIHTAQPDGGLSDGLLNISINPFLTQREREFAYLDSVSWFPLGQVSITLEEGDPLLDNLELLPEDQRDLGLNLLDEQFEQWYRLYFTASHKRTSVEFDPEQPKSRYTNLFSGPGISFNTSFEDADGSYFANATLGLTAGYIFDALKPKELESSLTKAKAEFQAGQPFQKLDISATAEEQRELNQRLNQNLSNSFRFSELAQLSGDFSEGNINLNRSSLTHIRTGLYNRRVEYIRGGFGAFEDSFGAGFFSNLDTSEDDFGNLVFQGVSVPRNLTDVTRSNTNSATEVFLFSPDSDQIIFADLDSTTFPVLGGKGADILSDKIEISRLYNGRFDTGTFLGTLALPSIELLHTGTNKNFNYGLSLGSWFNVDPSVVGDTFNDIGLEEPAVGAYFRGSANFILQDIKTNEEGLLVSATTSVPFIDVNWNSETNRLNAFRAQLGHSFFGQNRSLRYSLTKALSYSPTGINNIVPENSNGEVVGLLNAQLETSFGLGMQSSFEIGRVTFWDAEFTQRISNKLQAGLFYKNSTTNNIGLGSRIEGDSYGLVVKYEDPTTGLMLNGRVGYNNQGFDAELESTLNFNF